MRSDRMRPDYDDARRLGQVSGKGLFHDTIEADAAGSRAGVAAAIIPGAPNGRRAVDP
jgi:hypothetical protein